jgi:signal transduction histidine kinase
MGDKMKLKYVISSKLFLGLTLGLVFFNIFIYFTFHNRERILIDEKKEIFDLSIKNLAGEFLWKNDLDSLKNSSRDFINREEVVAIKVYDKNRETKVNYEESEYKGKKLGSQLNLIANGTVVGYLEVEYNYNILNSSLSELYRIIIQIQIIIAFIVFLFMFEHFRILFGYIETFENALEHLNKGVIDSFLDLKIDWLKRLESNFNQFITKVKNERVLQKRNIEEFIKTKDELEAAYNQMISINTVLETTLSSLETSESKYKNIFKYSPFGIALFNIEECKVEDYNKELINIFNNPYEKNLDAIFKNDGIIDLIKGIYNSSTRKDEEFFIISANKIVVISVMPFKLDNKFIQVFFKDITELKTLQIKLQDYAKDLEKEVVSQTKHLKEANAKIKKQQKKLVDEAYNKGLMEVTSGIIHNIGNIVNVISLSLDELINSKENNENIMPKFLDTVVLKEINALENLEEISVKLCKARDVLPKLLEYNEEFENEFKKKLDFLTKKVYHLKEIIQLQQNFVGSLGTEDYNDINLIIDEVTEIYESSLIKRNIKVSKNYSSKIVLLSDKAQFIQLISNFIKNSYEAIEEKNIQEGLIRITTKEENGYYLLEIYDNGIGIKEENLVKLFNFGYSTKKEIGIGSGYGLHSCRNIIEKYRGSIEVDSKYELYTKFTIKIPVNEA